MSITKHNWTKEEIIAIYNKPLMDLLYEASTIHREHHDPNVVQVSTLLSIKTGGCPEDCGYCPQAARYHTKVEGNDFYNGAPLLYSLWSKNSYLIDKFFPTCIGNFSRLCVLFRIACVTSQEHYITLFANEIHKLLPKSSDWNITLDNMKKIEQEVHFLKSKGLNKYIVLLT